MAILFVQFVKPIKLSKRNKTSMITYQNSKNININAKNVKKVWNIQ